MTVRPGAQVTGMSGPAALPRRNGELVFEAPWQGRVFGMALAVVERLGVPWAVLGLPPVWYKSAPYRSRAVIDPRGVLSELGVDVPADIEVRVWDSTAEIRYMVLPERPAGTERMSEAQLAELVTRDAMIGVAQVSASGARR